MLGESLALKGGIAINLTIFNLPRLSVDIDLDYAKNNSRDEMMAERADITDIIKRYMATEGLHPEKAKESEAELPKKLQRKSAEMER